MSKFTDKIKNDPLLKWGLISAFPLALLIQIPLNMMIADGERIQAAKAEAKAAEAAKAEAKAARQAPMVVQTPKPEPVVEPDPEPTMSMGAALSEMCAAGRQYRQFGASKSQALAEIRSYATFMMRENNFSMGDRTALIVHGRNCAGV